MAKHLPFLALTALLLTGCSIVDQVRWPEPVHPTNPATRFEKKGRASFYGTDFHGKTTANGEKYNMYGLTAAHRTLPFGTRVRVTCVETGRTVDVRINDRGPYVDGRILDLSYGAARKLGIVSKGIVHVRLKLIR